MQTFSAVARTRNPRPVKNVHLDNVRENKKLRDTTQSSKWKMGIKYEFTSANTPQQYGVVEVKLALIKKQGRAMMEQAYVPLNWRYLLYREVFYCATLLDGLIIIEIDGVKKTRFEHWNGKLPQFAHHLHIRGEAGVVKTCTVTTKAFFRCFLGLVFGPPILRPLVSILL
jgi:hypothetical protein